jgi:hypothetical protein
MPTWKGALKEDELWGLAYYVRSLVMMRDKDTAAQLASMLNDPKNMSWKPEPATETPGKEAPPAPKAGAPVPPKKG